MKLITLYLPASYIKGIDELVKEHFYPNRAEAIRLFIRDGLQEHNRFRVSVTSQLLSKIEESFDVCNY